MALPAQYSCAWPSDKLYIAYPGSSLNPSTGAGAVGGACQTSGTAQACVAPNACGTELASGTTPAVISPPPWTSARRTVLTLGGSLTEWDAAMLIAVHAGIGGLYPVAATATNGKWNVIQLEIRKVSASYADAAFAAAMANLLIHVHGVGGELWITVPAASTAGTQIGPWAWGSAATWGTALHVDKILVQMFDSAGTCVVLPNPGEAILAMWVQAATYASPPFASWDPDAVALVMTSIVVDTEYVPDPPCDPQGYSWWVAIAYLKDNKTLREVYGWQITMPTAGPHPCCCASA